MGCAAQMHSQQMADIRNSIVEGHCRLDLLEKRVYTEDGKFRNNADLITVLELGALYAIVSEFDRSNQVLEFAYGKYTNREERARINARDTTKNSIDVLFGEGSGEYKMAQFEKVYLHNIKAMNYLMSGSVEAARVEAQRAINRHRMIREYAQFQAAQVEKGKRQIERDVKNLYSNPSNGKGKHDRRDFDSKIRELTRKASLSDSQKQAIRNVRNAYENCYTYLLSALTFDLNREFENIRPQLKNASNLTKNRYVKKLYSEYQKESTAMSTAVNLYVFVEEDFAPTKKNLTISFLNPITETINQFSLAQINPSPQTISSIQLLDSTSNQIGKLEPLANLDLLSLKQYDMDLPGNITRAALRLVSQAIRDKAALDEAKNTQVSFLYQIGLSVLTMTTALADTRAWTLAPKKISFYCGAVQDTRIQLHVKEASGTVINQKQIEIVPEMLNIISVRCCNHNMFVRSQRF